MSERIESMRLELRRGVLVLAVLQALQTEHYGYSLRRYLQSSGLDIEEGTLYPLIRRLETYGLLTSRWSDGDGRKRRYYYISADGMATLTALQLELQDLNLAVHKLSEATQ